MCNHPYLIEGTEAFNVPPEEAARLRISASGKLQLFDRMLAFLHAHGHRVLVFSQFTTMLNVLEAYMLSRYGAGVCATHMGSMLHPPSTVCRSPLLYRQLPFGSSAFTPCAEQGACLCASTGGRACQEYRVGGMRCAPVGRRKR